MPPLYTASVPVFRHYLARVAGMVERAGEAGLGAQIGDMAPAGQQFAMAAGFAMRTVYPLAGLEIPDLPTALAPRMAVARAHLGAMKAADFEGAEDRIIQHRAGFADLEQSGADYLHLFGLPNFFFHLTMGYAALRQAGVELGKADFDAFHWYPADFTY
jgi:uncharacterized protein